MMSFFYKGVCMFALKKVFASLGMACFLMSSLPVEAEGIQLHRTRIVIDNGKNAGAYEVFNDHSTHTLIATWVEDLNNEPSEAFVISPSILQLAPRERGGGKIMKTGVLPTDRESVFWLAVKSIPSISKGQEDISSATFSLVQKIKIFYRPKAVEQTTAYAAEYLEAHVINGKLTLNNPSQVSLSIPTVTVNGKECKIAAMLLPFTSESFDIAFTANDSLTYTYIDEYGGVVSKTKSGPF